MADKSTSQISNHVVDFSNKPRFLVSDDPAGTPVDGYMNTDDIATIADDRATAAIAALLPLSGDIVYNADAVTDGNLAVFDGTDGQHIKDGGALPTDHVIGAEVITDGNLAVFDGDGYHIKDGGAVPAAPTAAGNDKNLQYNSSSAFAGVDDLAWDNAQKTLTVSGSIQEVLSISGRIYSNPGLSLSGGGGLITDTGGGALALTGGNGNGGGDGGYVTLVGGDGGATGHGGDVNMEGGVGGGTQGRGGHVLLIAGNASDGYGGNVVLTVGTAGGEGNLDGSVFINGGPVYIQAGTGGGTPGAGGNVEIIGGGASGIADGGNIVLTPGSGSGGGEDGVTALIGKVRLSTSATPASAGAVGATGDICWDSGYIYICISANTWKRAALSSW